MGGESWLVGFAGMVSCLTNPGKNAGVRVCVIKTKFSFVKE